MNKDLVKKIAVVIGLIAVAVILVKANEKLQKTSAPVTPPSPALTHKQAPAKTPAPSAPVSQPSVVLSKTTITTVYGNKSVPPQFYQFFHRFDISVGGDGKLSSLTIITSESMDYPQVVGVTQKVLAQKTWKDNLFKYSSILNTNGDYQVDLVSSGRIDWLTSCANKGSGATCFIVPVGTKITP